ncbi:DUF2207 domain-containing protein [Nesterenkonia salmonea]|uniref:DUF2207 domain-containing protein n=1 Tax=Nesterenkonia salmonea TaxID=1804987 RepID=A0A5R9BHW4_9MICC|nr:DUF2207 domain-containing protein [Nesterenkonia salmonea]TLQ00278.1 DUF2207 domain-containing protein [Nesterenkonia salmonea]
MFTLRLAAASAVVSGIVWLTAAPALASGDPEDDVVRDLTIEIEVDEDGVLHVEETYDWDFGERDGLGFYRSLSTEQPTDDGRRQFDYQEFSLSSPSGAPAEVVETNESRRELELTLGAPDGSDQTSTGVQTYQLSYTVHGAVDPNGLEWVTAGPHADVPMDRVTTEVNFPVDVQEGACWQGEDPDLDDGVSCEITTEGDTVTATAENLPPGGWQAVDLQVAADTFAGVEPIYAEPTAAEQFAERVAPATDRLWDSVLTYWWAVAAAILALAAAVVTVRRRRGADEHFPNLPQGSVPTGGTLEPTAPLRHEPPAVPRNAVPDGLRPFEAALLWHKTPHVPQADFTGLTVTDLAARGYLTMEETTQKTDGEDDDAGTDWLLTPTNKDTSALITWEREVLEALFPEQEPVRVSELDEGFTEAAHAAQKKAVDQFNARGLLARNVGGVGSLWAWIGGAVLFLVLATPLLSFGFGMPTSLNFLLLVVAVAAAAVGLGWAGTIRASNRRTAEGRVHYEQLRGLQLSQSVTVGASEETDLSPEEITEQLPYAMAFGDHEKWTQLMDARAETEPLPGLPTGSWVVLVATMPGTVGASHQGSGSASGSMSPGGFSAGSFGGGGGVAGR